MSNRLFVGNLPYDATEEELRQHFSKAGEVTSVFIPLDRETSRPRGFAFVEFNESDHAAAAIQQLHQKPFKDRPLVVNEARPNESRGSGPPRSPRPMGSAGRPMGGGGRPMGGGGRPPGLPRTGGPPDAGEEGRDRPPQRRASSPRSRRRSGKRGGGWEDGPRKEPIPEKRRGQIFSEYEDPEEEGEEVDFENFATSLPEPEDEEDS